VRLTREELYERVWTQPTSALAREFGISANGLAKICDRLLVPHPPRGYWAGKERRDERPPLPAKPEDCENEIVISGARATSRRRRTRLSLAARREQIADAAARLVVTEGVSAVSMKRLAREVGVSEALAYVYFESQLAILVYLARRERDAMNRIQAAATEQHTDYLKRVDASYSGYLAAVAERGPLLGMLLGSREVRDALKLEHNSLRAWSIQGTAGRMSAQLGVPPDLALAAVNTLRTVGLRAGALLANRKLSLEQAERLATTLTAGARARFSRRFADPAAAAAGADAPPATPSPPPSSRGRSSGRGRGRAGP
jgi:AcrR family transcriptional regulator